MAIAHSSKIRLNQNYAPGKNGDESEKMLCTWGVFLPLTSEFSSRWQPRPMPHLFFYASRRRNYISPHSNSQGKPTIAGYRNCGTYPQLRYMKKLLS